MHLRLYPCLFESSVNSEGIETDGAKLYAYSGFESSVNSEGIETLHYERRKVHKFESSVNSEGIETERKMSRQRYGLRAV